MADRIIRATAADAQLRVFCANARELAETARQIHGLSPVAAAALGRLLTAGAMMGMGLKGEKDLLTLQIKGDGPIGGLTVTFRVKGYADVPQVMLPPSKAGKLDVGGAVGHGWLQVIKDMGLKEPYSGRTELKTGEIAEDLTYYFAASEQVPSAVGLGVLMERDNTVKCAGGFIIQVMPFAEDAVIRKLENNLHDRFAGLPSVTNILEQEADPEYLLRQLLSDLDPVVTEESQPLFYCSCDKERVEKVLISTGKNELEDMIRENKTIEVKCHFCNTAYHFTVGELEQLYGKALR